MSSRNLDKTMIIGKNNILRTSKTIEHNKINFIKFVLKHIKIDERKSQDNNENERLLKKSKSKFEIGEEDENKQ